MTHTSHFNGDTLTLTSPRGSLELSQGQCASIVIMAEKHGPVGSVREAQPAPALCPGCGDKALADLAEAHASLDMQRKSNERARARYDAAHPDAAGKWPDRTDMVAWLMEDYDKVAGQMVKALADLAAERVKAERHRQDHTDAARDHADAEWKLDAARAEADALRRDLETERGIVCKLGALSGQQERDADALRKEVAELKGRKVKLPAKTSADSEFLPAQRVMWDGAINSCAAAIRAAGIEVAE